MNNTLQMLMELAVGEETDDRRVLCRIIRQLESDGEHLIWQGGVNSVTGLPYVFKNRGKTQTGVARFIIEQVNGKPLRKEIKAIVACEERRCVSPAHVDLLTHGEYLRARNEAYRTVRQIRNGTAV